MTAIGYRISPRLLPGLIPLLITITTMAACPSLTVTRNPENGRTPTFLMTHSVDKMASRQTRQLTRTCLGYKHDARYWCSSGGRGDRIQSPPPRIRAVVSLIFIKASDSFVVVVSKETWWVWCFGTGVASRLSNRENFGFQDPNPSLSAGVKRSRCP